MARVRAGKSIISGRPIPSPLLALSWRVLCGSTASADRDPQPVMAGPTPPAGISRALIVERSLGEEDERNVYELSFHNAALRSMLGLSGCVRLRLLDLSFNQIRVIEGIDTLVDLRELRLYGNAIQHVGGLACLRSLKVLLLHNNALEPPALDTGLSQLAQLATLRVDGNERLGAEGVAALHLARLPQLSELHASGVGLQAPPPPSEG